MRRNWISALSLSFCLLFSSITAQADEVGDAKQQLRSIISNLEYIKQSGLHMQDIGRIFILQQSAQTVLTSVEEKGLGNLRTLNLYQQLIVKFRFSTQFFEFIRTLNTEKRIADTLTTINQIREQRGFDDDPYSKILKSNLEQIHNSLLQLARHESTPSELKKRLQELTPRFGAAIAVADQGDRPKAFAIAIELHRAVRDLYPALQGLSSSPTAFRFVLEIMGLNEFVAEYSQVDRQ